MRHLKNRSQAIQKARVFNIRTDIKFCYTMNYVSPRYSQTFVAWIVEQFEKNTDFIEETKEKFDSAIVKRQANW